METLYVGIGAPKACRRIGLIVSIIIYLSCILFGEYFIIFAIAAHVLAGAIAWEIDYSDYKKIDDQYLRSILSPRQRFMLHTKDFIVCVSQGVFAPLVFAWLIYKEHRATYIPPGR
ncbi:MAG: hypothetical protein WCT24_01290 [Patescibacteria group bacterium]